MVLFSLDGYLYKDEVKKRMHFKAKWWNLKYLNIMQFKRVEIEEI